MKEHLIHVGLFVHKQANPLAGRSQGWPANNASSRLIL